MIQRIAFTIVLLSQLSGFSAHADSPEVGGPQNTYEKEVQSVVRNKRYFKAGKLEIGLMAGVLPYDSIFGQWTAGGRLTWHLSDHYGWEILDAQFPSGSVSSFITGLVSDSSKQIQDLEAVQMRTVIGSSFLMSPFYGKIRFFGAQVVYLDIYVAVGLGAINTQTLKYAYNASSGYTSSQVATGWDPALNYGVGFKFFLNNSFTLFFDMRNYMSNSTNYGKRGLGSNFTVSGGLSIFLPNFG